MFTINLEDGREAPSKASLYKNQIEILYQLYEVKTKDRASYKIYLSDPLCKNGIVRLKD